MDDGRSAQGTAVGDRWRRVATAFTDVVASVPAGGWDLPTPCEGWVARDVVDHLVTWVPSVLDASGVTFADSSGDPDPAARWSSFAATITAALADPVVAGTEFDAGPPGRLTVAAAVDMLVTNDVLVHTWDLAVATGQVAQLDPASVHDLYVGMRPMDDLLRSSGHYGPKVAVPDDADEETLLLAFMGRDVDAWR